MEKIGVEIVGYSEIAAFLQLSKKTIYKMTCKKRFPRGVYLGQGRFNLGKLKECIIYNGTHLATTGKTVNQ